jgi:hypothetical protein
LITRRRAQLGWVATATAPSEFVPGPPHALPPAAMMAPIALPSTLVDEPEPEAASSSEEGRRDHPSATMARRRIGIELSIGVVSMPPMVLTSSAQQVFVVLWVYNRRGKRWQEFGRTEMVRHHGCPSFIRSFQLEYVEGATPSDTQPQFVRAALNIPLPCTPVSPRTRCTH